MFDALGLSRTAIAQLNRSRHLDYRMYYDDVSRAIVAEHYRDDIVAFGYRFDSPYMAWSCGAAA